MMTFSLIFSTPTASMILSTWCKSLSSWLRTSIADADDSLADADSHADCWHWCCFCENLLLGRLCRLHRANEVHHNWELAQHQGICVLVTNMLINMLSWDRDYNNTDISDVVKDFTILFRRRLGCVFCNCQIQIQISWVGRSTTFPLGGGSGWSFLERRSSMMSSGTMPSMKIWVFEYVWNDKYLKCVSDIW